MSDDTMKCEICGEPMPAGEQMFKFHGYSGPCPKPALPAAEPADAGRDAYPFGQSEYPEQVIRLLIAGGYVSQAKVDEARAIALNLQPGPLSPPSEAAAVDDAERFGRMVHDLLLDARREEWSNDYFVRQLIKAEDDALAAALNSQQAVKP